jgi:hypothetical protein
MKGIAESTIVKIIIALIVIGVIVTLLYLGLGPFRDSVEYNTCKARVEEFCNLNPPGTRVDVDCVEKVNANLKGRPPLRTTC